MDIDSIAQQVRQRIDKSSDLLKNNSAARAYVDAALRPHKNLQVLIVFPDRLMIELVKCIINVWPKKFGNINEIEAHIKPLKEIGEILDWKNFTDALRLPDGGCRMEDIRTPINEFRKELWQKIFI